MKKINYFSGEELFILHCFQNVCSDMMGGVILKCAHNLEKQGQSADYSFYV